MSEFVESVLNIQQRQKNVVLRMMDLNQDPGTAPAVVWKVLIYDGHCQEILSPLLTVLDTRKKGITLRMSLFDDRSRIADASAVYFVHPSKEAIDKIASDCAAGLYDSMYINFSSSVSRELLEQLALKTSQSISASRISKVYDQYCNFVSLEPRLFSLNLHNSYVKLNSIDDAEMFRCIDQIVEGLFNVCVTAGELPVIRARPGEAAALIGERLDSKIRRHLKDRNNLFASSLDSLSYQRSVLILIDRNADLSIPFFHSWTYQALLHDILDLESNRVSIVVDKDPEHKESTDRIKRYYDLDVGLDEFWRENAGLPFPKVAENVDEQVKRYQEELNRIRRTDADALSEDQLSSFTADLSDAIEKIPELQRKKKCVDVHTNLASTLLKCLNERNIDAFFSVEEQMVANKFSPERSKVRELLDSKGTLEDKIRLFIIYFLTVKLSEEEVKEFTSALESKGADLSFLNFLKRIHLSSSLAHSVSSAVSSASGIVEQKWSGAIGKGIDWLAGNVKNLLPIKTDLPVTCIVKDIMQNTPIPGDDSSFSSKYLYFDPKAPDDRSKDPPRIRTPFKQAIVCMIGGGNYVEYQNLQDFAARSKAPATRSIIYGSTEISNSSRMLMQLNELGAQVSLI